MAPQAIIEADNMIVFVARPLSTVLTTFRTPQGLTCLKKLIQLCIETFQHRSQYPVVATHSILTKPTKPFILAYSVIAIMLHFSAPGKANLSVCSVTILAPPKLEVRGLIEPELYT